MEVLLAALFYSFHQVFPDRAVPAVFNEGHGREPWSDAIDLSNTVGWFTTIVPISVTMQRDEKRTVDVLAEVKDARRQVAPHAVSVSRSVAAAGHEASSTPWSTMEVLFNYEGRFQHTARDGGVFEISDQTFDVNAGLAGERVRTPAVFEVTVSHTPTGCAQIRFSYSKLVAHQKRIAGWIAMYGIVVGDLVDELRTMTPTVSGAVASSPLLKLNGASNVTINGSNNNTTSRDLTFSNTSATGPQVVVIGSTGTASITADTLKNCILINGAQTSTAVIVGDAASPGTAG